LDVEISLEAGPSVLYDALVIADSKSILQDFSRDPHALDFIRQQYQHCKPILILGAGANLFAKADVPQTLPDGTADSAIIFADSVTLEDGLSDFKTALAGHRSFAREAN
ncbi:MAG: catalase HPII, partial [Cellvibrio sp.]